MCRTRYGSCDLGAARGQGSLIICMTIVDRIIQKMWMPLRSKQLANLGSADFA